MPRLNDAVNKYYSDGNPESLNSVFKNLCSYLTAIGRKRFPHCNTDIEDYVQSTSVIMLEKLREGKFDANLSTFGTFSSCIFSRLLINDFRKTAVSNRHLAKLSRLTKGKESPEFSESTTLSTDFDTFLHKLEPLQLTLIRGKYYENKSQKILAQELGLSPTKVCRELGIALNKLRKMIT
jgi:RNA polymerase sigma factor (sigma-70 family)